MFLAPRVPVPVFPLPAFVLFPGAQVPLHIHESRYRSMIRDAATGERLVAMATLGPGWEHEYHGSPSFLPQGCLAAIDSLDWRPDDRYDLVLRGVVRVRFTRTVREFPYRACEVDVQPDAPVDEADPLTTLERTGLIDARERLLPLGPEAWVMLPVVPPDAPFERLVGVIAQSLRAPIERRLEWLALDRLSDRARAVRDHMLAIGARRGA